MDGFSNFMAYLCGVGVMAACVYFSWATFGGGLGVSGAQAVGLMMGVGALSVGVKAEGGMAFLVSHAVWFFIVAIYAFVVG